jgi:hypothetical protein
MGQITHLHWNEDRRHKEGVLRCFQWDGGRREIRKPKAEIEEAEIRNPSRPPRGGLRECHEPEPRLEPQNWPFGLRPSDFFRISGFDFELWP